MNLKEKNTIIEAFRKHTRQNHSQDYYTQIASQVYQSHKPENTLEFHSYTRQNWHWFFTSVLGIDVNAKKVPLWEQAMYPWKKY
jgi:hypothetical protein